MLKMRKISISKRLESIIQKGRVSALLGILSLADEEAYNHALAVAEMVDRYLVLAEENGELDWTEEECVDILTGALLHDIGKAFLPFGLQHCSGELSEYEFEVIKTHALLGIVSIKNCDFGDIVKNIILMHHANADGTGYPVIGEPYNKDNVPDYVWVVAYADRFTAMTSNRYFKHPMSYPEAWKEILDLSAKEKLPYKYTRLFGEIVKRDSILPFDGEDAI